MKYSVIRFTVYTLIIFAITSFLPSLVAPGDIKVFKENRQVEWLQFFLILSVGFIFLSGIKISNYRHLFALLAMIAGLVSIRELDSLLDRLIPLFGWELPATILSILCLIFCIRNYRNILKQMRVFIRTRAFSMLWCGFIVAIPFAQLVGHGDFLKNVMGDDYHRDYKRVIEEICELIGYLLILMGSIEAMIEVRCSFWKILEKSEEEKCSAADVS